VVSLKNLPRSCIASPTRRPVYDEQVLVTIFVHVLGVRSCLTWPFRLSTAGAASSARVLEAKLTAVDQADSSRRWREHVGATIPSTFAITPRHSKKP
jgi:hypothetical protein